MIIKILINHLFYQECTSDTQKNSEYFFKKQKLDFKYHFLNGDQCLNVIKLQEGKNNSRLVLKKTCPFTVLVSE
jgi:hypothetical protein